jgi:tetratricopeptide (TPR) repeat protein
MAGAARALALHLVLVALAFPAATSPEQASAEALAARLLNAPEAERLRLLDDAEFTSVEVARALLAGGAKAGLDANLPLALLAFRTAEAVARHAGAEKEVAQALAGAGGTLSVQGELARALEVSGEGLRLRESLGDLAGQADSWNTIGHIRHARAEYSEAFAAYRRAFDLWTTVGDRGSAGRAMNNIGNCHRALSDLDEAQAHYEQALSLFEELGDRRSAAVVTNNIGMVHFDRGDYPQALEHCTRSLAMNEALEDRGRIAKNLDSLGNIHRARGAYARALDHFHRSLAVSEPAGLKFQALETWNNVGLVQFSQGEYQLAIAAYKRGLRLNKEMGGTTLVAAGLYNIAAAARRLGERERAAANYRESLRICEREGFKSLAAGSLQDLGRMALEEGRHRAAEALLERALAIREALKDQAGTAEALNGLATLRLAAGRPRDALELARRASEIARRFEQAELEWEAETLSGIGYRRLGQAEPARRSFTRAIEVIENLRLQVVGRTQGRERFFESKLSPYHELMRLALAGSSTREALEVAERSRARALADLVQGGRVDIAGTMSDEDRREEGRMRAGLVSLNQKIQAERLRETPPSDRLAALEAERQSRRSVYESFQASLYAKQPDVQVQRGGAAPFTFGDAARVVPDASVAVLEYAVTEEGSHLFVLTRDEGRPRLDAYALAAGRVSVASRARRFRERLAARALSFTEDARPARAAARARAPRARGQDPPDRDSGRPAVGGSLPGAPGCRGPLRDRVGRRVLCALSNCSAGDREKAGARGPATDGARDGKGGFRRKGRRAGRSADGGPGTPSRRRAAGTVDRGRLRTGAKRYLPGPGGARGPLQGGSAAPRHPAPGHPRRPGRDEPALFARRALARARWIVG